MKFRIAYYLLLLYITVVSKPLIPVISDVMSHTFSEALHMATVHAKYGSNHVEMELANSQSHDNSKDLSTLAWQDEVPVHVYVEQHTNMTYRQSIDREYSLLKLSTFLSVFLSKNIPPPKFS